MHKNEPFFFLKQQRVPQIMDGYNIVVRVVLPVEVHPDKTGKMLLFL